MVVPAHLTLLGERSDRVTYLLDIKNTFNYFENYFKDIKLLKGKKNNRVVNIPMSIDIETTSFYKNDIKQATMYVWAFKAFQKETIYGRTYGELKYLLNIIHTIYNTGTNTKAIIYVHNLEYEFQFFRQHFEWEQIFATDIRKVLYARTTTGIEFRCSYILTGLSLARLATELKKYPCQKMTGELDYSLPRGTTTPLTEKDLNYLEMDTTVVVNAIQETLEREHKSLLTIELTNTGKVRTAFRKECLYKNKYYGTMIKELRLTPYTYKQLKRAFQGGYTHGNPLYSGEKLDNVSSYDLCSAYPAQMCSQKFPMSKGHYIELDKEDFEPYLHTHCCVFDIEYIGIDCKEGIPDYYISASKCYSIAGEKLNNGRVISADRLVMTLTEIDYQIINKCYDYDCYTVTNFCVFKKGYLPKPFVMELLRLFETKTELKGVDEKYDLYMVAKGNLNAGYGMTVTDILHNEVQYENHQWDIRGASQFTEDEVADKINVDNENSKRFLYYAWGVWVTAYTRQELWRAILMIGNDYLYSDTDSVKILNKDKHKAVFEKLNKNTVKRIKQCLKSLYISPRKLSAKTVKGDKKVLGVWEFEQTYDYFKYLRAKSYMVQKGDEYIVTIAGLGKKEGGAYIAKQKDPFKFFTVGMKIPPANTGKLTRTYLDYEQQGTFTDYLGNKQTYHEYSSTHLEPCPFEIKDNGEDTMLEDIIKFILRYNNLPKK